MKRLVPAEYGVRCVDHQTPGVPGCLEGVLAAHKGHCAAFVCDEVALVRQEGKEPSDDCYYVVAPGVCIHACHCEWIWSIGRIVMSPPAEMRKGTHGTKRHTSGARGADPSAFSPSDVRGKLSGRALPAATPLYGWEITTRQPRERCHLVAKEPRGWGLARKLTAHLGG